MNRSYRDQNRNEWVHNDVHSHTNDVQRSRVDLSGVHTHMSGAHNNRSDVVEQDHPSAAFNTMNGGNRQPQVYTRNVQREEKKLPFQYPMPKESKKRSPYEILGVNPDDSIDEINAIYKKLVINLHPDKGLNEEAIKMGWTIEDKNRAFRQVRKAYKTILKSRKESDCPDYNIDYYINEEFTQTHRLDRLGMTKADTTPDNFNINKFNRGYEAEMKYHEQHGFSDPYSRGYNEFDTGKDYNSNEKIKMPVRADIDVTKNPKLAKAPMKNGQIIRHVPKDQASFGMEPNGSYAELGITNIQDFSMTMDCKGGICGSDLMAVYGQNTENWEDSVARDRNLYSKYNDETRIDKKMNLLRSERENFDFKAVDPEIQRQIRQEEEMNRKMDQMRASYIQSQDRYYDEYASRMLRNVPNR